MNVINYDNNILIVNFSYKVYTIYRNNVMFRWSDACLVFHSSSDVIIKRNPYIFICQLRNCSIFSFENKFYNINFVLYHFFIKNHSKPMKICCLNFNFNLFCHCLYQFENQTDDKWSNCFSPFSFIICCRSVSTHRLVSRHPCLYTGLMERFFLSHS